MKNHKERVESEKLMKRWRKIDSRIDSRRGIKRTPRWRAIQKEHIRALKATGIWYELNDPEYYL